MGINFQFGTASQIIFGNNSVEKIKPVISGFGRTVLLVTGKNPDRTKKLIEFLPPEHQVTTFVISKEPTVELVNEGIKLARNITADVIIGFGGGSVIDGAKAIAALTTNPGELMDYLEVIGKGKPLQYRPVPFIAIPTTSGTGAEVTKNAVIKSEDQKVKVSLRHEWMYPTLAVVDPIFTYSMSPELTAITGMDALTHLIETFVSVQPNNMVDMFCREGLSLIGRSLKKACENGQDEKARADMAMASMLGGMALANGKLGAIHGFAGPLGGMYPLPHGVVCARFAPPVMKVNYSALKKNNQNVERFDEVARLLTCTNSAKAIDGILWLEKTIRDLKIPTLVSCNIAKNDFPHIIEKAKNASSMKGNPLILDNSQLVQILTEAVRE